ncbi:MAG: cobamide remodeling phosphodiesterase CbiR [Candidatus Chlorobium antarcticum]|jgi:sugar phosphate isomerase/epimerase|nr:cobamide remodeling phosphodiesterase CbiR [Candidatus Chlorobium antarcticum]
MASTPAFPFRFGTTSYIVPDEIIPNVEFLKERVDDIELVLFESDEFSNLPSEDDIRRLANTADEHGLSYSVHLPLDAYLGHSDRSERLRSVEKCRKIIELTRPLPVSAFVTHAEAGPGVDVNLFTEDGVARFSDMFRQSINQLLKTSEASADEFAVETLNYPYAYIWPVVDELGLSVTLDVGHLEFYGFPLEEHLKDYLNRTRVLHVHGVREGKDHNSLVWYPSGSMDALLAALQAAPDSDRVFTMEIFSLDDFESSSALMHERRRGL